MTVTTIHSTYIGLDLITKDPLVDSSVNSLVLTSILQSLAETCWFICLVHRLNRLHSCNGHHATCKLDPST